MHLLLGIGIVFASILFGFTMHGGKVAALIQISEFIIIGGAALGSVVVGYSPKAALGIVKSCLGLLKGNPFKKKAFLELLNAMYDLFSLAKKDGMLALEQHIDDPQECETIKQYPALGNNEIAVDLLTDTLKLVCMGGISTYDLAEMMDIDLEVQHEHASKISNVLNSIADSMPGFGIVAAVLGVVVTMQAIGGPPEEIGHKVAAALVGTFLGVLLAYGVFAPLSKATENVAKSEIQFLACIKNGVVAFSRGDAPLICVEFARRNIEPEVRPGFREMEDTCRGRNKTGESQASEPEEKAA